MDIAEIELFGGPFDGRTELLPASEGFEVTRTYRPDHAPETMAVYRLRLILPGVPRQVVYQYQETVANPAA